MRHVLACLVVLLSVAPIVAQQAEPPRAAAGRVRAVRADLAEAYLRLEHAFFSETRSGPACAAFNRRFDAITLRFFSGQYTEAVAELHALTEELHPAGATPAARLAHALRVRAEPGVVSGGGGAATTVRLDSFYPVACDPAAPVVLSLQLRADGNTGESRMAPVDIAATKDGCRVSTQVALDMPGAPGGRASYRIELMGAEGVMRTAGRVYRSAAGFDAERGARAARVRTLALETPELQRAGAILLARNELQTDSPSATASSEFMTNQAELGDALDAELESLAAGRDPYDGHVGDLWRVVPAPADLPDAPPIPVRVYAPAPADRGTPRPLLIAVHGAGGDENMFFEGYGVGVVKRLADQHGFVVAAPRADLLGATPAMFDRLVADIALDHAVDRSRVYLVGHSMGGGIVSAWARARPDQLAGVCTIAGVGGLANAKSLPPVLVIAAELDGLIPVARVRAGAERAAEAGLPVEFREIKDYGHTLVVGHALPGVVEWLLRQRRPE